MARPRLGDTLSLWTENEIDFLKKSILEGKSYREISELLYKKFSITRTRNSISAAKFRYIKDIQKPVFLKPHEFDKETKEEIFKFRKFRNVPLKNRRSYAVPVSLLDVKNTQCRWPLDGHMCCGAKVWGGRSYCYRHAREAFTSDTIEAIKKAMR